MAADPTHARERAFYAAVAEELDPASLPPHPPDHYEAAVLDALGDVSGLDVLDAGCGAGDLTLELLRRGARVTALDLSADLLAVARARVERFAGPEPAVRFVDAPLEDTGLPARAFDRAAGKWVLHHTEIARSAPELRRLLRSGGRAAFFENQATNPVLAFGRRRLLRLPGMCRVGTPDERPLTVADYALLRSVFAQVELSFPNLYFAQALSRSLGHRGLRAAERVDAAVWRRAPRLRRHSWHVLVQLS